MNLGTRLGISIWTHVKVYFWKEGVMETALRAKFAQHPRLRAMLLETGSRRLVEHTENDHYWGDGGDGTGRNRLGHLLMQVRDKLQAEAAQAAPPPPPPPPK